MTDKATSSFSGRIGGDLKEIPTKNDSKMVSFNLVTNHYQGKKNPTKVQGHPIIAFGNHAEYLLKYAKKGDSISLDAEIDQRIKGEGDSAEYYTNHRVTWCHLFGRREKDSSQTSEV